MLTQERVGKARVVYDGTRVVWVVVLMNCCCKWRCYKVEWTNYLKVKRGGGVERKYGLLPLDEEMPLPQADIWVIGTIL